MIIDCSARVPRSRSSPAHALAWKPSPRNSYHQVRFPFELRKRKAAAVTHARSKPTDEQKDKQANHLVRNSALPMLDDDDDRNMEQGRAVHPRCMSSGTATLERNWWPTGGLATRSHECGSRSSATGPRCRSIQPAGSVSEIALPLTTGMLPRADEPVVEDWKERKRTRVPEYHACAIRG